ncbi:MAG: hypothetical protein SPK06_04280 [Kiritimatiellia bacterium]|nr:hypothetical protein [Kiritimatiellia bacterium]
MKSKQPYASSIASLALLILVGCATQRTVIRKDGDPEIKVYGPDRIIAFGQTIPLENLDRAVRQHRLSEHENLQIMFYTDRRTDQPLMKAVTAELLQAKQKQFHLSRPRHATSTVKEPQP